MPSKDSTSDPAKRRQPPLSDDASSQPADQPAGAERPPESAENFEHVLRRLISGRGAGGASGR
jgi:hypothetical protein